MHRLTWFKILPFLLEFVSLGVSTRNLRDFPMFTVGCPGKSCLSAKCAKAVNHSTSSDIRFIY